MLLELNITSYQRLSPSVTSRKLVEPGQVVVVGRSTQCDWHLPDPSRVLSSSHAEFRLDDSRFVVADTSTNGLFVNNSQTPVGRGNVAVLSNGDVIRLGDFELSVGIRSGKEQVAEPVSDQLHDLPEASLVSADRGVANEQVQPSDEVVSSSSGMVPGNDFRDFLGAGLDERVMEDSHVELQGPEIPGEWNWGVAKPAHDRPESHRSVPGVDATSPELAVDKHADNEVLSAIFEGLGLGVERVKDTGPEFGRQLGALTRVLLDRLLDMIHVRARQKQQLRVAQTLFQRTDNNPLKFSATPQDAIDSLLLRPHEANLGPIDSVNRAFDDLFSHEQALLKGVEAVVQDILSDPTAGQDSNGLKGVFARRKTVEIMQRHRSWQKDQYGSNDRMLRSDVFIEAYEEAAEGSKESAGA